MKTNQEFASFGLMMISFNLFGVIVAFYWSINFAFESNLELMPKIAMTSSLIFLWFVHLTLILYLNLVSQWVTDEVSSLKNTILDLKLFKIQDMVERFQVLCHLDAFKGFEAKGYFVLGKPLMTSVMANFVTFIIVLIQFKSSEST